jgi:hypothetical protein
MTTPQKPTGLPATSVTTGKVRLSYVSIFEAKAMDASKPEDKKFSVLVMIPKSDTTTVANIKKAIAAAEEAGIAKVWGGKKPAVIKNTFKDADKDTNQSGEIYADADENVKGHYIINVSSKNRPGIVDSNLQEILNPTAIKSGDYGKVNMNFFAYKHATGGVGISAGLQHVMFLEEGESLGGRVSAEAAFGG